MRRNLSQVGNPGWASMGDGMKPERLLHTHALPFLYLRMFLPDSSSCFKHLKKAIDSRKRDRESDSDSA